jgi:hypothetical protein
VDTPTADEIRARSKLLRARYPDPGAEAESGDLVAVIEDAAAVVAALTGRLIAPMTVGEEVPAGLVHIAVRAVARAAELMDTESAADFADVAARGRRLRGFTAGPYSEQYFAPGDLIVTRGARPQFSPDPTLDRLLWALATQDAIDELIALASGVQPPAGMATGFDFRKSGGGYFPRVPHWRSGPDGL